MLPQNGKELMLEVAESRAGARHDVTPGNMLRCVTHDNPDSKESWTATSPSKTTPWCFAGRSARTSRNRAVWLRLRAVGASAHYTELAGVNHNAWDPVYDDAELVEWLLTQLRR